MSDKGEITQRLHANDPKGLVELVQSDLESLAFRLNPSGTIDAGSLVAEYFFEIASTDLRRFENRDHFFATANEAMHNIYRKHYRSKTALKRGGDGEKAALRIDFNSVDQAALTNQTTVFEDGIDKAIRKLEKLDFYQAKIVRMHFYDGWSKIQIADDLGKSRNTVAGDLKRAIVWLRRELAS